MTIKHGARYAVMGLLTLGLVILVGLAPIASNSLLAQETTSGITIFGGLSPENRLAYSIDRNRPYSSNARYYLRVGATKLRREVLELQIDYPETFEGKFDPASIELRRGRYRGDSKIEISEATLNTETRQIEIYPSEPIPVDTHLVVVLSNVRNPRNFGVHYFNLKMMYQGGVVREYVGTWPLEVSAE